MSNKDKHVYLPLSEILAFFILRLKSVSIAQVSNSFPEQICLFAFHGGLSDSIDSPLWYHTTSFTGVTAITVHVTSMFSPFLMNFDPVFDTLMAGTGRSGICKIYICFERMFDLGTSTLRSPIILNLKWSSLPIFIHMYGISASFLVTFRIWRSETVLPLAWNSEKRPSLLFIPGGRCQLTLRKCGWIIDICKYT